MIRFWFCPTAKYWGPSNNAEADYFYMYLLSYALSLECTHLVLEILINKKKCGQKWIQAG